MTINEAALASGLAPKTDDGANIVYVGIPHATDQDLHDGARMWAVNQATQYYHLNPDPDDNADRVARVLETAERYLAFVQEGE